MTAFADCSEQSQPDEEAETAARKTEEGKVLHAKPSGLGLMEEERWHLVAEQKRGTDEERAGEHAENETVDARSQAAVIEVHVEFAVLHLLQDLNDALRQDFDKLLDFHI